MLSPHRCCRFWPQVQWVCIFLRSSCLRSLHLHITKQLPKFVASERREGGHVSHPKSSPPLTTTKSSVHSINIHTHTQRDREMHCWGLPSLCVSRTLMIVVLELAIAISNGCRIYWSLWYFASDEMCMSVHMCVRGKQMQMCAWGVRDQ